MFASGLSGASADLDGSGEGVSRPARGEGVKTGCRVVAPGATLTGMAHQPLHLPATDRPLRDPSRPAQDGTFALSDARDGPPEGERWSAWDHATGTSRVGASARAARCGRCSGAPTSAGR